MTYLLLLVGDIFFQIHGFNYITSTHAQKSERFTERISALDIADTSSFYLLKYHGNCKGNSHINSQIEYNCNLTQRKTSENI